MNQTAKHNSVNPDKKAMVVSNLICLLSVIGLGSFPLILWAHWRNLVLSHGTFVYPIPVRPLIIFYWSDLLPKSGVLIAVLFLCAWVGFAADKFSRRILEAAVSLLVGWLIVFHFFLWFVGETHFFENR